MTAYAVQRTGPLTTRHQRHSPTVNHCLVLYRQHVFEFTKLPVTELVNDSLQNALRKIKNDYIRVCLVFFVYFCACVIALLHLRVQ